ncbi:hypothetical protein M9458_043245, partial [Cirrhinus mrigala]
FLTSIDGHDRCLTCLGRAHAEAAFVDGSCAHCERMSMATLRRLLEAGPSAEQHPSAVAVPSEADAELSAMLLRAADGIRLEVPKVPPPDPSRLDDWFLGTRSAAPPRSPPVPFFPEVHDELVSAWRAPYSARSRPTSSALATLDGGPARGYEGVPQVERAVHLCPQDAATWRGSPRLPSKACRLSSALTGKAYSAAGQAATALHAMATLQVYQAKALKELHKGSPDQAVLQELRAATDFALRATKVTARSLGQVMSTLMVQERHLWLNLAQMADVDKARFLDAPVSQAGLFGDTFSAVQKQTEAISHILPRRVTPRNLLGAEGAPLRPPRSKTNLLRLRLRPMMRALPPDVVAAAGERRRPLLRSPPQTPKTRSLEMMEAALRGTTTSAPPLPVEGRDRLCAQLPSTYGSAVPTHSQKEQFSTSLGQVPEVLFLTDNIQHSPAWEPGKKTALQDVHPSGTSRPTAVTSVNAPLIPLAARLAAWLELPSPSRLLIRTVRLGYVIHTGLAFPHSVAAYSAHGQTLPSYGPEHVVVHTDASTNGQAASGSWTGP